MKGVELRHLETLRAVATSGSFTAAAEQLGCTQSAVSSQVRVLESFVGTRLVERVRGRRGVRLTRAGTTLYSHAIAIAAEVEAAARDLAVVVHELDVIAVGIEHERCVIADVVDRPLTRRAVVAVPGR